MPWYVTPHHRPRQLAFVLGVLAPVGLKGVAPRQARHGRCRRRVTPLVDGLTRRGDEIAAAAERLSGDGEQLNASICERCSVSLARLQVVTTTINQALRAVLPHLRGGSGRRRGLQRLGHLSRATPELSGAAAPERGRARDPLCESPGPVRVRAAQLSARAAAAPPSRGSCSSRWSMYAISACGNVSASSSSMGFSVTQSGSFSDLPADAPRCVEVVRHRGDAVGDAVQVVLGVVGADDGVDDGR